MIRSWGKVTVSGFAQPWFGDVLTAAVGLPDVEQDHSCHRGLYDQIQGWGPHLFGPWADQSRLLLVADRKPYGFELPSRADALTHTHLNGALVAIASVGH